MASERVYDDAPTNLHAAYLCRDLSILQIRFGRLLRHNDLCKDERDRSPQASKRSEGDLAPGHGCKHKTTVAFYLGV